MSHRGTESARTAEGGPVRFAPVAGRIGAVAAGVRLDGDLADDVVALIWDAVLRHKVLFFRGQRHLDPGGQVRFAPPRGAPKVAPP
ncbi:MAG: TauD/TfdA family dioxygenase, partial [Actinomadura rubrobrunea]|nr:TauD/TfdA family dioxygenase [Actinomadura rubrobrunea]